MTGWSVLSTPAVLSPPDFPEQKGQARDDFSVGGRAAPNFPRKISTVNIQL